MTAGSIGTGTGPRLESPRQVAHPAYSQERKVGLGALAAQPGGCGPRLALAWTFFYVQSSGEGQATSQWGSSADHSLGQRPWPGSRERRKLSAQH